MRPTDCIKFIFLATFAITSFDLQAQDFFNYQAIIRDSDGNAIASNDVSLRMSLIKDDFFGEATYQEEHVTSTSEYGSISIGVGNGIPIVGVFSDIEWGEAAYFLKVELKVSGSDQYVEMGITQILAVPISLYARRSGDNYWIKDTETILTDNSVGIGTGSPSSKLTVAGVIESTEGGVKFPDGTVQSSAAANVSTVDFLNRIEGPVYTSDGNVGIGVGDPSSKLTVGGQIELTEGGIKFQDGSIQSSASVAISTDNFLNKTEGPLFVSGQSVGIGTNSPSTNFEIKGSGSQNYEPVVIRNNHTMNMLAYASGNIDFLNASFVSNRSRGTYEAPQSVVSGDRIGGIYGRAFLNGDYQRTTGIQMFVGSNAGTGSYPSNIRFETTTVNSVERAERMRIADNGYIGIGTTNPLSLLTVNGTIHSLVGGIKFPDGSTQVSAATSLSSDYFNKLEGPIYGDGTHIGLGTESPQTNFEVVGDGNNNYEPVILRNDHTMNLMAHASGEIDFLNASFVSHRSRGTYESPANVQDGDRVGGFYARYFYNGEYRRAAGIQMYVGSGTANNSFPSLIKFETTGMGEVERSERMRLTEEGFLGIGTSMPESMLTVNGIIETMEGGIKFPDGSTQVSAATSLSSDYFNKLEGPIYGDGAHIGLGTESPQTNFEVVGDGTSNYEPVILRNDHTMNLMAHASGEIDFLNASFVSHRSRGTYESPANVQDGDRVGGFYARYFYNGEYRRAAGIQMYVGSGTANNSFPSLIKFETTGVGEVERSERMRLTEEGFLGIGTETPGSMLTVNGVMESLSGGVKFPDGSVQETAANTLTNISENESEVSIETANLGLGTLSPKSKLHVSNGDIYLDDAASGVIMKSPDGNCWRMTVDNSGVPVFTTIVCPGDE